MIRTLRRLDRVPLAAWMVVGTVAACASVKPAQVVPATGDALRDLRVAADHVEAGLPLARLACARVRHADERADCLALADRLAAALPKARAVLARAEACADRADEDECISLAVDAANVLLHEMQGGDAPAPAPSASAAPAPSGSAAP